MYFIYVFHYTAFICHLFHLFESPPLFTEWQRKSEQDREKIILANNHLSGKLYTFHALTDARVSLVLWNPYRLCTQQLSCCFYCIPNQTLILNNCNKPLKSCFYLLFFGNAFFFLSYLWCCWRWYFFCISPSQTYLYRLLSLIRKVRLIYRLITGNQISQTFISRLKENPKFCVSDREKITVYSYRVELREKVSDPNHLPQSKRRQMFSELLNVLLVRISSRHNQKTAVIKTLHKEEKLIHKYFNEPRKKFTVYVTHTIQVRKVVKNQLLLC